MFDLRVVSEPLVVDVAEEVFWRERVERAEERAERAEARIEELVEQVAMLSRMLFGRSSEKVAPDAGGVPGSHGRGDSGSDRGEGERPRRGQRPGSAEHGRRDYSHLASREEIHDVPPDQRVCADCGRAFDALGSECSEQIDWQVQLTRIVHRRMRYRRACACPADQQASDRSSTRVFPTGEKFYRERFRYAPVY